MSKRISFTVHGVVQGVNFRAWTAEKANGLKVTGFVRNSDDGTVTGEAQGSDTALDKFVELLGIGPHHAKVDKAERESIDTKTGENTFQQIRR